MMDNDGPPKRVVLALRDTSQVESRAALHWALNTLPIRPGVDYVLLFHVVKCMKIISDGRKYANACLLKIPELQCLEFRISS